MIDFVLAFVVLPWALLGALVAFLADVFERPAARWAGYVIGFCFLLIGQGLAIWVFTQTGGTL